MRSSHRSGTAPGRGPLALLGLLLCLALAIPAEAQSFARRRVSAGEVTGLEMAIEGSLETVPGGRVRWFVTLYEVLRRRDLRVSPGSTIRVTATYSRSAPIAEVTTDARGRAALELAIPEDLESSPHLMLEAISPRGVRRIFEVSLALRPRFTVELFLDRMRAPPGATVAAFGRVLDHARSAAAVGHEVVLQGFARGPLGPPITLHTDAAGVFSAELTMPEQTGTARVRARIEGYRAEVSVDVVRRAPPPLVVAVAAERDLAPPDTEVSVDVWARTPDGLPVAGAQVGWADERDPDRVLARTDAEGHARLSHRTPATLAAPFADTEREVRVVHPAYGAATAPMTLRVAARDVFAEAAVEGGALVPGLEGRVLVRLVGADGGPLAGRAVMLDAPRLGGRLRATTDAEGVAVLRGRVGEPVADARCGGPTFAAAVLEVAGSSARERLCLSVDPDRTMAVRADPVQATQRVRVELDRRPEVARAAVVLTALARRGDGWAPVAQIEAPPGAASAELELPAELRGEVWLRARPMVCGARGAPCRLVRGGGALTWIGARPRALELSADAARAVLRGVEGGETAFAFALAPERADALLAALRGGPVSAALERAGSSRVRMVLASRVPRDETVSAILRGGALVPVPLPEAPARLGLLRDPWRTRARFVRGRIGRLMLAVEGYVASRVPGHREDVAVRVGRRWRFNTELLEGALDRAGLAGESAAALDGEPLDIEALRALDPAFTYDNVARRITRERLWHVYARVRQMVRDRQLDVAWARRGDPALYLVALLDARSVWTIEGPIRSQLFDGWGTPLALRPARGRDRFTFLEPVPGWELASAGPDLRFGTRDDVVDPFARVLPAGLYAEAVGEEALLARLGPVALGRATAASLGELFAVEPGRAMDAAPRRTLERALPPPIEPAPIWPLDAPPPRDVLGGMARDGARDWTLPRERRRYAAVGIRFSGSTPPTTVRDELVAGARLAARFELPEVVRPGEVLEVPLAVARLSDDVRGRPVVEVSSEGALEATLEEGRVRLRALRVGVAQVRVAVRLGDSVEWSREADVRVLPPGQLRARHASAWVTEHDALDAAVPAGATPWRAALVIAAPRALDRDPMLAAVREAHPALFAWARAMRGDSVDPALLAAVTRQLESGALVNDVEAACALSAWARAGESGPLARGAEALGAGLDDDLATRAAVLAALAPSAPGVVGGEADPVARIAAQIREDGWRALASTSDQPAVMARMAAALLLADRRDAPGRALLARARAAIERDAYGRSFVPGDPSRPGDGWIGTLALAIAARQVGDDALARELGRSAASRLYLGARTGVDGAFWLIAASVYGAFGVEAPEAIAVAIGGAPREVELTDGIARIELAPGERVEVRGAGVLARVASRFIVSPRSERAAPLELAIEGEPGRLGDRAAYELIVRGRGAVGAPVVEITIPGAARLDEEARASIGRAGAVHRIEGVDRAGRVRIRLAPLADGGVHRVPLPWRWIASGHTRGLDVAAFDASRPWEITTLEGRTIDVEAR